MVTFTVRRYLKTWTLQTLSLLLLLVVFLTMMPLFLQDTKALQDVLANFPSEFLLVFGMDINQLFTAQGFYGFIFSYILLFGCLYAMQLGIAMFADELQRKTGDFLLTKPISRLRIFLHKVSASLMLLLSQQVVIQIVGFVLLRYYEPQISIWGVVLVHASLFLLQCLFFSFGLLLSLVKKKTRPIALYSMIGVGVVYVVGILESLFTVKELQYLAFFHYFDTHTILLTQQYDLTYLSICVILTFSALLVALIRLQRMDIKQG